MSDAKPSAPRWLSLYTLPILSFGVLAWLTEDTSFILFLNILLTSLATVVVITFTPEQVRIAFNSGPMTRGAWFAFGIWWGWGAILARAIETLVWRYMGQPLWLVNSDITSLNLYMACVGAFGHIVRPGDLADRLPKRELVKFASYVGFAVFVFLVVWEWSDIQAAVQHQRAVWFRTPGIESTVAGPPPKTYSAAREVPRSVERSMATAPALPHRATPDVTLDDLLRDDDGDRGTVRMDTTLSPSDAARVEASRVAHGDRSRRAALRRLIPRALDDEDRDALGTYDPERK